MEEKFIFPPTEDGIFYILLQRKIRQANMGMKTHSSSREGKADNNNRDRVKGELAEDYDTKRW